MLHPILALRLISLVLMTAILAGCQAHKINLLRVESPLGVAVTGAEIEIGSIHSGHVYPPPRFPVDPAGNVRFPEGTWVNSGTYIALHLGDRSAFFDPDDFHFASRRTLVLRLSQAQMLTLYGEADLSMPPSLDFGIPSQDLRFRLEEN